MKNILLVSGLLLSFGLFSQSQASISGTITDQEMNGEPLLFADIVIKNTNWNTRTNLNGNFEIQGIDSGNYILAVSFPGYETIEKSIIIEGNVVIKIKESLSAKSIDVSALLLSELDDDMQRKTVANTQLR